MPSVLLVKTSSMGDVIHNLPVVSDIRRHRPDMVIDWAVEEAFAELPRMHPGVREAIPVAVRRWRKTPFSSAVWREVAELARRLRSARYERVIDTQGLIKSAAIARLTRAPVAGMAAETAREPIAARFYRETYAIPRNVHAVERNRWLAAAALGYEPDGAPDYGIHATRLRPPWGPEGDYAVLLHGTSRADKEWAAANWVGLGQALLTRGMRCVLPWGNAAEEQRARELAAAIPDSVVAQRLTLGEAASLMAGARIIIGTDTGLSHLAAALGKPIIALFAASDPELTGVLAGPAAVNLGTRGAPPETRTVLEVAARLLGSNVAAPASV